MRDTQPVSRSLCSFAIRISAPGIMGEIASCYRPGHADYTFQNKYGFRDYRGGGRTSGRETIGRVAAGAVASALLKTLGIKLTAFSKSIGPVTVPESEYRLDEVTENPLYMPNNGLAKKQPTISMR